MKVIQITDLTPDELQSLLKETISLVINQHQNSVKTIDDEVYYTRKQVASLFDVELSTIHNWSKKGILHPVGLGNRVYFKRSEIEQALIRLNP